ARELSGGVAIIPGSLPPRKSRNRELSGLDPGVVPGVIDRIVNTPTRPRGVAMSFELFFDLDADWRIVAGSRAATDAMQRWANDPVLGACRSLDELLARTAAGADRADAESVLRALVRLAPDDDIAARTVLQALVPALVSVARRVGAADNPDAAAEVVAVAWTKIRHAIGSQRRGSIAANLVLEVLHVVWRSQHALAEQLVAPADLGRVAASD